jgi:hypothetical protein
MGLKSGGAVPKRWVAHWTLLPQKSTACTLTNCWNKLYITISFIEHLKDRKA